MKLVKMKRNVKQKKDTGYFRHFLDENLLHDIFL